MKSFDNHGKLVSDINHSRTADGTSITTNTIFDTNTGMAISQNISVLESNGKVTVRNVIGGKLLP